MQGAGLEGGIEEEDRFRVRHYKTQGKID